MEENESNFLTRVRVTLLFSISRLEKFYQSSQYDFSSGRYSGESAGVRLWRLVR